MIARTFRGESYITGYRIYRLDTDEFMHAMELMGDERRELVLDVADDFFNYFARDEEMGCGKKHKGKMPMKTPGKRGK